MGSIIGSTVQVVDPEDYGLVGEFLWVQVAIDITKSLPQCCKLWSEGEQIGLASLNLNVY